MQLSGGESLKNPVVETIKDIYQKKGILGFYKNVFRSMPIVALSNDLWILICVIPTYIENR